MNPVIANSQITWTVFGGFEAAREKILACHFIVLPTIENVTFSRCEFIGCEMHMAKFSNCAFDSCQFVGGSFTSTQFTECKFQACSFCEVDLRQSSLVHCLLKDVEFKMVNFRGSLFLGVRIEGLSFLQTKFDLSFYDESSSIPEEMASQMISRKQMDEIFTSMEESQLRTAILRIGDSSSSSGPF